MPLDQSTRLDCRRGHGPKIRFKIPVTDTKRAVSTIVCGPLRGIYPYPSQPVPVDSTGSPPFCLKSPESAKF
jgi:hypothetical protein